MIIIMRIIETEIKGILIIEPEIFSDNRGLFCETYSYQKFNSLGINTKFVQDNISVSKRGVVRGLHFQLPPKAQAKLCQVIRGRVLDVAVDLRNGSPSFGEYFAIELSEDNFMQLYIPIGFAHGFAVLSDEAVFQYKCSDYYSREHEMAIRFDDPTLNINWSVQEPIVSDRDKNAKLFNDIKHKLNFEPD